MEIPPIGLVIVLLIILLVMFSSQIMAYMVQMKSYFMGGTASSPVEMLSDDDEVNDPKAGATAQPATSDSLKALGYVGGLPWSDVIKTTELDPSTFINHEEFVKDVRRFSSGANFTSVTDDNTNLAFVNYVGLRKPESVTIGSTARQIPDVDETVLQRNKVFRWNATS